MTRRMTRGALLRRLVLGAGLMMALGAQTCAVAPPPTGGLPGSYDVPRGSYLGSCENARVIFGDRLVAECRDPVGRYVESDLTLPCRGDIANDRGRLVCQGGNAGYDLPDGSYRGSCRNIDVVRGDLLVADCRNDRGGYFQTSLRLPCADDIANENGQLVCRRGGPGYGIVPEGSYRRSCRNAEVMRGDVLVAECRNIFGHYAGTSLNLPCRGDIANEGGQLVCDRGDGGYGGGFGVPRGSYLQSCRDPEVVRDNLLIADCRDISGRYVSASLTLPCYGDVANDRGRLVCRR